MMNLYPTEMSAAFPDKKIMIVLDQSGWHNSKSLDVPDNFFLELLPPYSPELDPVEKLWQHLKKHACRNRLFIDENELIEPFPMNWPSFHPIA